MPATVKIHTTFRHDCSGFPNEPQYDQFKVTKPYQFRAGDEVTIPDDAADYFTRAGWAAAEGEEPVKPDPTKPVLVQVHNSKLGVSDTNQA